MVKIEGDEIVIRIPICALPVAAQYVWDEEFGIDEHDYYIDNIDEFAKELVSALCDESEDGSTVVHDMLDKALISVTEDGGLGFNSKSEPF